MPRGDQLSRQWRLLQFLGHPDPYHLTYFNGGAYLVGYCHLRREVRIFAVERIRAAAPLDDTFAVPGDFDAETYLSGAWGIVRGDLVAVRAVFSRAAAPYVRERLWHPSQALRELPGGRLELRLAAVLSRARGRTAGSGPDRARPAQCRAAPDRGRPPAHRGQRGHLSERGVVIDARSYA